METSSEKKWFIYVGDHHQGPFSTEEIQSKIGSGEITKAQYVWADGMTDWKPILEVNELGSLFSQTVSSGPANTEPTLPPTLELKDEATVVSIASKRNEIPPQPESIAVAVAKAEPVITFEAPNVPVMELSSAPEETRQEVFPESEPIFSPKPEPKKSKGVSKSFLFLVAFLLILAGTSFAYVQGMLDPLMKSEALKSLVVTADDAIRPQLIALSDKIPALQAIISPIARVDDISSEDYEELKQAARAKPESGGIRAAVALSKNDLATPQFYVSSALDDGANFDIHLIGIGDSLLNTQSFSTSVKATLFKKLSKSGAASQDGKPIPRGDYMVYVMESDQQPKTVLQALTVMGPAAAKIPESLNKGKKLVTVRKYFLGGPKDANYQARLKQYHEKIKEKALSEISEVKQFFSALASQLSGTQTQFEKMKKLKNARSTKRTWQSFNTQWMQFNQQLEQSFLKWTPETLKNEFYYPKLYESVKSTAEAVMALHVMHNRFFNEKTDAKSFPIQLGETLQKAQMAVASLQAKVEQVEKLPPTAAGLPRKMDE